MGPEVPLLNDYKQEFFWKRFPQTLLGGPRLKLGYCAPPYVYLHQLLLFLTPCLLGGVGTALYQVGVLGDAYAATLSGGLMLAVAAVLQTLAQCVARRTGVVQRLSAQQNNILADEEEVEFSHCVAPETVRFVVPGKKFIVNVVLHTLLAGMLCGLGTWYLLPGSLSSLYGGMGAAMPVFALSWVTLCSGEYALIVNTPPETATFQPQDTYEITALTRPLYILIFIAVDLVYRLTDPMNELRLACQVLHGVFVVLPVLWALGTLPPPDALLLWAMEQVLVLGLGGSPMATNFRLLVMFLISTSVAVSAYFIPSSLGVVLFTVATGYLLSQDGSQLGALCGRVRPQARALSLGLKGLPLGLLFLAGAMAEGGLLHYYLYEPFNQTVNVTLEDAGAPVEVLPSVRLQGPQAAVGYVLICLFLLSRGLREIQGVFLLGGSLRNPLYPRQTGCSQAFRRSSRGLLLAGYLRRALLHLVAPFAMIAFLALDASLQDLHTASLAVGFTRAFRMAWQSSDEALLQMVIVVLARLGSGGTPAKGWHGLGTGIQLLVIGLLMDRASQFVSKLRFALTVIVTSWTETKQRRQSTSVMLVVNAVLFPLLLGELVLSALLSAPLLPLFTLPIFLVGFPRPLRSWPGTPGTACPCPDSVYYQQLSTRLASALRGAIACGALGAASPGSHFLCRFQDRVMWLTVLERGYGYCTLNIKGLELQETSCHTLEARRMDEVFEAALAQAPVAQSPCCRQLLQLNPHWGNTLTPRCALPVRLYSDARNVLTGIIDSHEHLRKLRGDYVKVLLWLLLQRCAQRDRLTPQQLQEKVPLSPGANSSSSLHALRQRDTQVSTHVAPSHHSCSFSSSSSSSSSSTSPDQRGSLSSSADWLDDDDLFGPQVVARRLAQQQPQERNFSLPGSVEVLSLYENMALSALPPLRPLGLGMPAADRGSSGGGLHEDPSSVPTSQGPGQQQGRQRCFSGPHSQLLPGEWRTAPLAPPQMQQLQPLVPSDWFHFAVGRVLLASAGGPHAITLLQEERDALELFGQVALSCLVALGLEGELPSPSLVFRLYGGGAPWSEALDWLKGRRELHQLALKAFRYSFKLLFDQASLGPIDSPEELQATLDEYEHHWYIGTASDHGWQESVRQEKPFLFSLGHDLAMGTYTGRVLTLQEQLVYVGQVCAEGVRGQWANLSWELLYATNDDEERYSIQAHPVLLRNLTVQAADPPLGYPIFSSAPLHLACL